jgi:hypothetical protein
MGVPYIGFANTTLDKIEETVHDGDSIKCSKCGGSHKLEAGTANGVKNELLLFYTCGDSSYLAAVSGKLISGIKADIKGEL